jgi:hypothetical protein
MKHTAFCGVLHGREDPAGCGEDTRLDDTNPELAFRRKNRAIFFVSPIRYVSKVQLYPDEHTRRRRNER